MKYVRTTVVLPEEDVRMIKILAAKNNLTMSQVIQKSVRHSALNLSKKMNTNKKSGWRAFAGSLNLGGKEPPTRAELYEKYFSEKSSR